MGFGDHGCNFRLVLVQFRNAVARVERLLDAGHATIRRPVEEFFLVRDLPAVVPRHQQRQVEPILRRKPNAGVEVIQSTPAVSTDAVVQLQSTTFYSLFHFIRFYILSGGHH